MDPLTRRLRRASSSAPATARRAPAACSRRTACSRRRRSSRSRRSARCAASRPTSSRASACRACSRTPTTCTCGRARSWSRRTAACTAFIGWDGPMLTDSGGFQVFSLDAFCRRSEEGVEFKSPLDGRSVFLSPERAVEIQEKLGADLIVVLDEFEEIRAAASPTRAARARVSSARCAGPSAAAARTGAPTSSCSGSCRAAARPSCAPRARRARAALGFGAFAIGGLGVGETPGERDALLAATLPPLSPAAPRYLMGLGLPEDLVAGGRARRRPVRLRRADPPRPTRLGVHVARAAQPAQRAPPRGARADRPGLRVPGLRALHARLPAPPAGRGRGARARGCCRCTTSRTT